MDEGWTRFIFDQNAIPYTRIVDADIRKGNLNDRFDVIVLPDNSARAITTGRGGFGEGPGGEPGAPQAAAGQTPGVRPAQGNAQGNENHSPKIPPEFTGGLGDDGVASLKAFTENRGHDCGAEQGLAGVRPKELRTGERRFGLFRSQSVLHIER